MKNIHILKTNKPSRLFRSELTNNLGLDKNCIIRGGRLNNQHIYITSDEEIKEGDWCIEFTPNNEKITELFKCNEEQVLNISTGTDYKYKKIILTTDQDLIKDGVQEIDDEFLEWFVKNPSCEFVMTIPDVIGLRDVFQPTGKDLYKIIIPKEEHKQETVEEVAKKIASETFNETFSKYPRGGKLSNETLIDVLTLFFRLGSEWQQKPEQFFNDDRVKTLEKGIEYLLKAQESMYTEEQVKMLMFDFYYDMSHKMNVPKNLISENATNVDEWFKQYKKKC